MLSSVTIQNFAIIDSLHLDFKSGLTIFTGETGAGKSIIIDALSQVIGKMGDESLIQTGHDEAIVTAAFTIPDSQRLPALQDLMGETSILTITKRLLRNKPSITTANGRPVTLKKLRVAMHSVLNIIGQHDTLQLFDSIYQLQLVDTYGGPD
ncbi:AAA family ATPase, partial [bacterium]|nr:AAA family ATPase [bacterium]